MLWTQYKNLFSKYIMTLFNREMWLIFSYRSTEHDHQY